MSQIVTTLKGEIMEEKKDIKLFEDKLVRSVWNNEKEEWFFSSVDVVEVLTDSVEPKQYLKKLKTREEELNNSWRTIPSLVDIAGNDGKTRKIQSANMPRIQR